MNEIHYRSSDLNSSKRGGERIKILILSLDYPPNDGGISRLSGSLVSALGKTGRDMEVVTTSLPEASGLPRPIAKVTEVSSRRGLRDLQIFQAIRQHLWRHGRTAPVLATVWNPEATIAVLAGAKRVTVFAHGNEVMPYSGKSLKGLLRKIVLERARAVVCNSHFTEGLVRKVAPRAKTHVLNPAVDAERFRLNCTQEKARDELGLPQGKRILLTIARLDPIKGHETVLRALAALDKHERSETYYVAIGKGAMESRLKALCRELGIERQVKFAGFVSDNELDVWFRACDLFVLPSVFDAEGRGMEGFGMAFTEAQAAGLPVIGTRSGGIPDAVRVGEGGWLISERDHIALAKHLQELLSAPATFKEQGRRGQERIRREMNWTSYAAQLIRVI